MKALSVCFFLALVVLGAVQHSEAQRCNTSLADAVSAAPQLSQLSAIIILAGLADTFSDPSLNVTVFAPNNAAIEALTRSLNNSGLTLANLTGPSNNRAASIVLYHVLTAPHTAAQLVDNQTYPTLYKGETLQVEKNATTVKIDAAGSDAVVVTADISVCNSWVHIIDDVLLPVDLDDVNDIEPYPFASGSPPPPGTPPAPPGTVAPPSGATTLGRSTLMAAFAAIAVVVATL